MYDLYIKEECDSILAKIAKKNRKQFEILLKKVTEIRKNPTHIYKFLRKPLQGFNRAHIDSSFVLIFKINHQERAITLYYFDHHDDVYQWRPKEEH